MIVRTIYMLQAVILCQFFTCTVTFILLLFSSAFVLNTLCAVDAIKPKEVKFDVWFVLFMSWFKMLFPSPRSNGLSLIFSPNYFKIPGFCFVIAVVFSILLLLLGFSLISSPCLPERLLLNFLLLCFLLTLPSQSEKQPIHGTSCSSKLSCYFRHSNYWSLQGSSATFFLP